MLSYHFIFDKSVCSLRLSKVAQRPTLHSFEKDNDLKVILHDGPATHNLMAKAT